MKNLKIQPIMKKFNSFALALVFATSISGQVFAQEGAQSITKQRTKSNNTNEKSSAQNTEACVVKIESTETGCDVVFMNESAKNREAGSGMATGKRMHKPISFNVSSSDNSVSEITSPRDIATGQASGKRSSGTPIGGIIVKGGKNPGGNQFNNIMVNNGQFTLPDDCPDGDYDLILSWSWGASNSGSSKTYCSCHFILTLENGACMAINTKGTGASNK